MEKKCDINLADEVNGNSPLMLATSLNMVSWRTTSLTEAFNSHLRRSTLSRLSSRRELTLIWPTGAARRLSTALQPPVSGKYFSFCFENISLRLRRGRQGPRWRQGGCESRGWEWKDRGESCRGHQGGRDGGLPEGLRCRKDPRQGSSCQGERKIFLFFGLKIFDWGERSPRVPWGHPTGGMWRGLCQS